MYSADRLREVERLHGLQGDDRWLEFVIRVEARQTLGPGVRRVLCAQLERLTNGKPWRFLDSWVRLSFFEEALRQGGPWGSGIQADNPLAPAYAMWILGLDTSRPAPSRKEARTWRHEAIWQLSQAVKRTGHAKAVDALELLATNDSDSTDRAYAVRALAAAHGGPSPRPAQRLLEIAHDRRQPARGDALNSAGLLAAGDTRLLEWLLGVACDRSDPQRASAVLGLQHVIANGSIDALKWLVTFTGDPDPKIASVATAVLRHTRGPMHPLWQGNSFTVEARRAALDDRADPRRALAIWLLHYGGVGVMSTLSAIALDRADSNRLVAVWALARISIDRWNFSRPSRLVALSTLIQLSQVQQDPQRFVSVAALVWAAARGELSALETLLTLASRRTDTKSIHATAREGLTRVAMDQDGRLGRRNLATVASDSRRKDAAIAGRVLATAAERGNLGALRKILELSSAPGPSRVREIAHTTVRSIAQQRSHRWHKLASRMV